MTDNNRLTIDNVREQIVGVDTRVPLLDGSQRQYVNFDNAASTPALRPVHDKLNEFMTWYSSVHRGTGFKSQIATETYELAHDLVGHRAQVGRGFEVEQLRVAMPVKLPGGKRFDGLHGSLSFFMAQQKT